MRLQLAENLLYEPMFYCVAYSVTTLVIVAFVGYFRLL